ncbi:hypothetical protein M409DRAFT_69789 [Zasmidium cellare ATCC 36951]|uniref:D-isomer specific 2-hydroxyacid dehydrogenase NAD-binding domain-containing protein n=1 Tax=Zasmidium cellare ATCC 36951 TaxID=1080233 RepID=A0A6A6C2W4_ZASCE|nr:uncharacterized protein M409DRAFT_69789 [Zasmidium cellare ATCC 36951]KAF2161444.1 hypothetical protein M409DRAFT_69789 [Zasmidium cellare ATCC 36951]
MTHHIVALDGGYVKIPPFSLPNPHKYTEYSNTLPTEVPSRVSDATIVITNLVPLSAETLRPECTPYLQLIAVMAAGVDCLDLPACKARGIRVCNIPGGSAIAVSEHTIGLYFAVRRKTVQLHYLTTKTMEWEEKGTLKDVYGGLPLTCESEVMGILGYGSLGQKIAGLARALGMQVLVASRKDDNSSEASSHNGVECSRTPFHEVLRRSTVLVIAVPRLPSTTDMISTPEFSIMQRNAILINVARGGIVNESALVRALKQGLIAGAATDVFTTEPAGRTTSPLLAEDVPNLTVSPHLAWYAQSTQDTRARQVKEIVEGFVASGEGKNVVV